MSNGLVSVIIVTAGKTGYLGELINSVTRQTRSVSEIILVDNSLNHELHASLAVRYPSIVILQSQANVYYCQALNRGIKKSKGDFVLCLNDDVILHERFIDEALRGFSLDPRIGMVSGKILRIDKRTIDSTGLFLSIWRTAKERGYGVLDDGQFEKEEYIFGVNGAVAFYRRSMLEDIKVDSDYFDEEYRIFYEDLDIAWRARHAGWMGYYIPVAVAYHARGATVRNNGGIAKPFARTYLNNELHLDLIKNRYLTVIKNESCVGFLVRLPFFLCYDIATWLYVIIFRPALIPRMFSSVRFLASVFRKRLRLKKKRFF